MDAWEMIIQYFKCKENRCQLEKTFLLLETGALHILTAHARYNSLHNRHTELNCTHTKMNLNIESALGPVCWPLTVSVLLSSVHFCLFYSIF